MNQDSGEQALPGPNADTAEHTVACMDSLAQAKGLPTYTELRARAAQAAQPLPVRDERTALKDAFAEGRKRYQLATSVAAFQAGAIYGWQARAAIPQPVAQGPAVKAELPPGVVVSGYRIGDGINAIRIERVQQISGPDMWAARRHGDVLNRSGVWEWEPMPSSRDDEFLARCRFGSHAEAIAAVSHVQVQVSAAITQPAPEAQQVAAGAGAGAQLISTIKQGPSDELTVEVSK